VFDISSSSNDSNSNVKNYPNKNQALLLLSSDSNEESEDPYFTSTTVSQSSKSKLLNEIKISLKILKNIFMSIEFNVLSQNRIEKLSYDSNVSNNNVPHYCDLLNEFFTFSFSLKKILIFSASIFNSEKEKDCFMYLYKNNILELENSSNSYNKANTRKEDVDILNSIPSTISTETKELVQSESPDIFSVEKVNYNYSPLSIALFFKLAQPYLDSTLVGEFLGKKKELNMKVLFCFANLGEYLSVSIDEIIRIIMCLIKIPGFIFFFFFFFLLIFVVFV
jgi:hypothetical protein